MHFCLSMLLLVAIIISDRQTSGQDVNSLFQLITANSVTRWTYVTLVTRGPDYFEGINDYISVNVQSSTTTNRPTGTTYPTAPDVFQCNFDSGLCGFQYDTQATFNWTRWTMQCPHTYTGPSADHTTGSGYYMYIDCSAPRVSGMVARLVTPELSTLTGCANISFWYNAYGFHLARFTVKIAESPYTAWTSIWEISGADQDQNWRKASIVAPALNYRVVFEGVVGSGYQGDYAFDDVLMFSAPCSQVNVVLNSNNSALLYYTPADITTPAPGGLQTWAIALIVVSIVAAISAVLLAVYIVYRQNKIRRQRERDEKEEEERRQKEIEEEGVIHTDRSYSTRLRSGAGDRPVTGGRMVSAQRRMAPGYGARPGSRIGGNGYGRLDIPTSAMSKRGYSQNSALAVHRQNTDYSYDQPTDGNLSQRGAEINTARLRTAAEVRKITEEAKESAIQGPTRLPSIFGGESPPGSAHATGRSATSQDLTISDASPMVARRSDNIDNPANLRPETPKTQPEGETAEQIAYRQEKIRRQKEREEKEQAEQRQKEKGWFN